MKTFFFGTIFWFLVLTVIVDYAAPSGQQQAAMVLNSIGSPCENSNVITKHEWDELHLDKLLENFDRTKTSFGRWGLEQLLHPIANITQLQERQDIIRFLVSHQDVLQQLQTYLNKLQKCEEDMLVYWDKHDSVRRSIQDLYFTIPFLQKELNKSAFALDCGVALRYFNIMVFSLQTLCLSGMFTEFMQFLSNQEQEFSMLHAMELGLQKPLLVHSFKPYIEFSGRDSFKSYVRALLFGSLNDRYRVASERMSLIPGGKLLAALFAITCAAIYDIKWMNDVQSAYENSVQMCTTLSDLQHRIIHNAQFFGLISDIERIMYEFCPVYLRDKVNAAVLANGTIAHCIDQLQRASFGQGSSWFYSRGKLLIMHAYIQKKKHFFIPLLQSIGLLDAYCSLAQLYNEHVYSATPFCFVQYSDNDSPMMQYDDAQLPSLMFDSEVTNNVLIGDGNPKKIIITGPNGGGKSGYLRMVGQLAIMAQSWTFVPARRAQQTLFSAINTSFTPHEKLYEGLSTFMSEKKRMEEIRSAIKKSSMNCHVLALIDEPYRGTVDDESAKRIYEFGTDVAHDENAAVYIATHVKKPIYLAQDTHGVFANYQIQINDKEDGTFERTFKLIPGPALWWFEDENKRSRFVDWVCA